LVVVVFELEEQPAKSEAIIIITEITNINLFILFPLYFFILLIFTSFLSFNSISFDLPPQLKKHTGKSDHI
jgi:hypothetical protein